MKKSFKKVLSIILALVMLLSVFSVSFYAFAAEGETVAVPGIQTMLTDGKALKQWLETGYLNLDKADALLSENLPAIGETACGALGDLFYQMGYSEEQYPKDEESLMLALARIIGSLNAEVFREPEKVETTDMELVYNLAYLGGTEYIESINAALPAALRFDTSTPVLSLTEEQAAQVREYYARWKAGALKLDDFDIKAYLGDMSAAAYLKTVLLIFIADDNRLPAIAAEAIGFNIDSGKKALLAGAVAEILDHLETTPVSSILKVLSNSDFHALLKAVLETANKVTVRTDYYSYKLFNEGIYTDTDGSPVAFVSKNEDGTYSYMGPSMISEYNEVIDALLTFLDGIDEELSSSVLETVFSKRLDKLAVLADKALTAAVAAISGQQNKLTSDIASANIEIRVANQKIEDIDSGKAAADTIATLQTRLDALSDEIAALQAQLHTLESEETLAKDAVKGYYDALAEFEAQMSEENAAEITANPDYITAKAKVEETENSLAENYASQKDLKDSIAEKSEQADTIAERIVALQNGSDAAEQKAVYARMIREAQAKITESEAALADLPSTDLIDNVAATLKPLVAGFFTAFHGVYDTMMNETPIKAAVALVYGLKDFIDAIEAIDWDAVAPVTDPLFAQLDAYLDGAAGRYIGENGGANILADLSEWLNTFLDTYGVYNYFNEDYLNNFISSEILGDNSAVMEMASDALKAIFPNVQPTYESIVSCLIPILSAFNFGEIMGNLDNISAALGLASPVAFAYLAGIDSPLLTENYLNTINSNLTAKGYTGTPVTPLINLTPAQQTKLLEYVAMEKGGKSLSEIAQAGFNWTDFAGGADSLDLANAFIKIALGDPDKLGAIAESDAGPALINLLCDLLNDIQKAPVSTILKKLSDAEGLSKIVDFAMSLLNGSDADFKSFELFNNNIFVDGDGNTTFYDKLIKEDPAEYEYTGPKAMDQYIPVIAAVLDFLSNISGKIDENGGDVLKTLLVDKLPQLGNIIRSAISYKDEGGNDKVGMIAYLLDDYKEYLKAINASLSDDVLISIANTAIKEAQDQIEASNAKIATWQSYLAQAQAQSDAAKLAKAKELGLLDASVTTYDEEAVNAAIEAKAATLRGEITALEAQVQQDQQNVQTAQDAADAAEQAYNDLAGFEDYIYEDPFYSDLGAIFDDEDTSLIDNLRDDCEDDVNEMLGDGTFDQLATLILEHLSDYSGDADTFIDDYILNDGINYYAMADEASTAVDDAKADVQDAEDQLQADSDALDAKGAELTKLENGDVLKAINAAGDAKTIYISDTSINAEGDFTVKDIEESIKTIQTEEIAGYESTIAAEQAKIGEYTADKAAQDSIANNYDLEGLNLEQKALNGLVDALMVFLGGDENTKSLYEYFNDGQPIEMLVAPDRVNALKNIVDGLITLFGDKIGSGEDYTTRLWDIEDILFGDKGILSTLYDDFKEDPVLSVVNRIPQIKEIVDVVYDMGFLRDIIDQYKDLIDAVAGIFGDESEGFIAQWKSAYDDGTASHHYVNAILSLLPKIVEIYDQVKDMDAVKELLAPYSDLIDIVLGLLSKDFYDDVVNNGIVETLLEDENLEMLRDTINKVLDTIQPENYQMYKMIVEVVFDKVLDGLYQDLLVDPVLAVTKRLPFILDVLPLAAYAFEFDITPYMPVINDLKTLIDDNFTKDWQKSKTIALVNRIAPLSDLLVDVLNVVPADTLKGLLNNLPDDVKAKLPDNIVEVASDLLKSILGDIKTLSTGLVNDYHKSPVRAIAKRVPVIADMLSKVLGNNDLVELVLDIIRDTDLGEYENLIRRVVADYNDFIAPVLKDVVNEETLNTYNKDKLKGALKLLGGALDLVKNVAADEELINDVLDLEFVKNFEIPGLETTVGDISGAIKLIVSIIPDLLDGIDAESLVKGLLNKPVETIIDLAHSVADAIDTILAADDPFINQYTEQLEETLELVRDILQSITIKNGKITTPYLNPKKILNSALLNSENINRIVAAVNEVADFIENFGIEGGDELAAGIRSLAKAIKTLDGLVDRLAKQPLLKTVEQLGTTIKEIKPFLQVLDIQIDVTDKLDGSKFTLKVNDYMGAVDILLDILKNLGSDAQNGLVGAILSRAGKLSELVKELFKIDSFKKLSFEIVDKTTGERLFAFRLGDFENIVDLLAQVLDDELYSDYKANPTKAIFDRVDYIRAIYEWLREFGILDTLELKLYGYDILEAVDILIPLLDKQLYYDFEQSLWKAVTSSDRIGRLETALKSIIRFADIFSYSVNEGLCSLISGACGVLDGLYDSLALPTSTANGGNQLHQTSRVIVKKLPAIQNLLRSLKPLLGKEKLINLTDVVSDTVKMEKDDILKAIVGVDLIKPYYYGISDILDVVGENAAKYDWNTFAGIIDALNGVGVKLVPALEKALGVSDVTWKDLILPTPEYKAGGTAEDYLVELSGELGEGILTQLVGTLLKAALTIPAIKDMIGDVDAEAVAGLLNDLLEFDFKDNKVEFDAFNTEHLILTGINLLLPKTAPAPSPATADEVVMIVAVIGTTAAASTGVFLTLKKRREEMSVDA